MNPDENIVLFDGICNLCNNFVTFIIRRDPESKIKFAPLQSEPGRALIQKSDWASKGLFSVVFIQNGKYFQKSTAVLYVFKTLGGFWKLFFVFKLLPERIRDFLYDFIAKNRYRFFGKRESCMVPTAEIKSRFIE